MKKKKTRIIQDYLNIIAATGIGAFSGVGVYTYTTLFLGMIMSGLVTSMIIILMYSIERIKK